MITILTKRECYAVSGGEFSITNTTAKTLHTVVDLVGDALIVLGLFGFQYSNARLTEDPDGIKGATRVHGALFYFSLSFAELMVGKAFRLAVQQYQQTNSNSTETLAN